MIAPVELVFTLAEIKNKKKFWKKGHNPESSRTPPGYECAQLHLKSRAPLIFTAAAA